MLMRLLSMDKTSLQCITYNDTSGWFNGVNRNLTLGQYRMCISVQACCDFIRKGQEQMMADYLMLELLEQGRL